MIYRNELIILQLDNFSDDDCLPTRLDQPSITKHHRTAVVHLVVTVMAPL